MVIIGIYTVYYSDSTRLYEKLSEESKTTAKYKIDVAALRGLLTFLQVYINTVNCHGVDTNYPNEIQIICGAAKL